ncbi:MAG: tetratricopeptide repeat protein [Acidobacteria bacterium]|nr:tetratricopeptide repeat protein [Acidobacteriota bacterium]
MRNFFMLLFLLLLLFVPLLIGQSTSEDFVTDGLLDDIDQDFESAIINYTLAIKLDPKDGLVYKLRGQDRYKMKDYDGAIADITRSIDLGFKFDLSNTYVFLGIVREAKKDLKGAIADHTKAIEINSKNVDAYYFRGLMRFMIKDYQEAINDFTESIKIDPKFEFGANYIQRARAYRAMNKISLAVADEKKAAALAKPRNR